MRNRRKLDKMDKVQDILSSTFVISITQMFCPSGYAVLNVCLSIFVCATVSLFLITLKSLGLRTIALVYMHNISGYM